MDTKDWRKTGNETFVSSPCDSNVAAFEEVAPDHLARTPERSHYQCTECHMSFAQSYALALHHRTHTGENSKGTFEKPSAPATHEPKNSCQKCGMVFAGCSDLQAHERTHTEALDPTLYAKPMPPLETLLDYASSRCNDAMAKPSDLAVRERSEAAAKRFSCAKCGKEFTKQFSLRRHEENHSGEKRYQCTICQQTFTQSGSLTRHKNLLHLKENQTKANLETHDPLENKAFIKPENQAFVKPEHSTPDPEKRPLQDTDAHFKFYLRHEDKIKKTTLKHVKSYACTKCGRGFTRLYSLKRHDMYQHIGSTPTKTEGSAVFSKPMPPIETLLNSVYTPRPEAITNPVMPLQNSLYPINSWAQPSSAFHGNSESMHQTSCFTPVTYQSELPMQSYSFPQAPKLIN